MQIVNTFPEVFFEYEDLDQYVEKLKKKESYLIRNQKMKNGYGEKQDWRT